MLFCFVSTFHFFFFCLEVRAPCRDERVHLSNSRRVPRMNKIKRFFCTNLQNRRNMNHIQTLFLFFLVELNRRLAECAAVAAEATNMMNYPVQQQPKVCEHFMIKFSLL